MVLRDRTRTHGAHNRLLVVHLVVRGSVRGSVELDFHLREIFLEIHDYPILEWCVFKWFLLDGSGLTPSRDACL